MIVPLPANRAPGRPSEGSRLTGMKELQRSQITPKYHGRLRSASGTQSPLSLSSVAGSVLCADGQSQTRIDRPALRTGSAPAAGVDRDGEGQAVRCGTQAPLPPVVAGAAPAAAAQV